MIDREKLLSISVAKARRKPDAKDRALAKDLEAYRRLRHEGLQPPSVDGAARLERQAVTKLEIETGVLNTDLAPKQRRALAKRLSDATRTE
jgi:hypothetical protein